MTKKSEVLHALGMHDWIHIGAREFELRYSGRNSKVCCFHDRRVCLDCGIVERDKPGEGWIRSTIPEKDRVAIKMAREK